MKYTQVKIFDRKLNAESTGEDLTEVNNFLKEVDDLVDIKTFTNDILVIYNIKK